MTTQRRLWRATAALALITALARLAGFTRTVAFGRTVGADCVGSVYQTANFIPNIVFDIVAGGMLSALVVPIVAPAVAGGDRVRANQLTSALINWTVVILAPIAVVTTLAAGPIVGALLGPQPDCAGAQGHGTRMLEVFAPQIVFYGLAVVLGGMLTARERFSWPAITPLLSSLVVIATYVLYDALAGPGRSVVGPTTSAEYVLSIGTTLGVVVLAGGLFGPAWRSGVRWSPTLRFPDDVGSTVKRAAVAGAGTLAALQVATAVMIRLANSGTAAGTLVIVVMSQSLFLLPWAVLSLPIATTTFPRLSAEWASDDRTAFKRRIARAGTVVILAGLAGTALLITIAEPAGLILLGPSTVDIGAFGPTATAFAFGLTGWSMVAVLGRALYASGHFLASAAAQIGGQVVVIVVDIVLSVSVDTAHRAVVLGIGNSVGATAAAVLLVATGRRVGAFRPTVWANRTTATAVVAAVAAALIGSAVGRQIDDGAATLPALGRAVAAAVSAALVFGAILLALDRYGVRNLLGRPAGAGVTS